MRDLDSIKYYNENKSEYALERDAYLARRDLEFATQACDAYLAYDGPEPRVTDYETLLQDRVAAMTRVTEAQENLTRYRAEKASNYGQ